MVKVILSSFPCNLPVVDGMDRTVMIATETTGATAVMLPLRYFLEHDITDRTLLGATSTVDADVTIDGKLLVRNHETVEVGTDDVTERPGSQAQCQLTKARLPTDNNLYKSI